MTIIIETAVAGVKGSLRTIQILRGVASLSVLYLHLYVNPNFGHFGVDLFFVISGLVMSMLVFRGADFWGFFIGRISRILPLYWFLTSLLFLFIIVAPKYVDAATVEHSGFLNYLKSIFLFLMLAPVG